MTTYLMIYRADRDAATQLAQASPEQQQAGMSAWMDWFARAGDAVVDPGAPLVPVGSADPSLTGYSVVRAESTAALDALLDGHPHAQVGTIEIHEFVPMPGM